MDNTLLYTIYPCGDHAITVDFGNVIDENINRYVHYLFTKLKKKNVTGVKDILPAYCSVTIVYDVVAIRLAHKGNTAYNAIVKILTDILDVKEELAEEDSATIKIPVCYEPPFAPDLHEIATQKNLPPQAIVQLHCSKSYRVFMLGFLPGFAYMGVIPDELELPRKTLPRTKVPTGSVGIAGKQTGIYPFESPGGWNIIGQTPFKMFNANRKQAALLKPGDMIQFYPISHEEFKALKAAQ